MSIKTLTTFCKGCGQIFEGASATMELMGVTVTMRENYCPTCQAEKEQAAREMTLGSTASRPKWKEVCPAAYQGFDMARLPESSRATVEKILDWKWGAQGIGLIGESRAGKTFAIHEVIRRLYAQNLGVKLLSGTGFAFGVASLKGDAREALINACIAVPVLLIDDIDKMKVTDRVEADLYHVIEERRKKLFPIFCTLNARGEELKAMMGDNAGAPIVNRLREDVCKFYAI